MAAGVVASDQFCRRTSCLASARDAYRPLSDDSLVPSGEDHVHQVTTRMQPSGDPEPDRRETSSQVTRLAHDDLVALPQLEVGSDVRAHAEPQLDSAGPGLASGGVDGPQ
jgi:hypothetical protein